MRGGKERIADLGREKSENRKIVKLKRIAHGRGEDNPGNASGCLNVRIAHPAPRLKKKLNHERIQTPGGPENHHDDWKRKNLLS
jgi:hypothetical protein